MNGIRIKKESFANVVTPFVIWLDQTYPHLQGVLEIRVEKGVPIFLYEPLDGKQLSPQDKALIRAKWMKCMEQRSKEERPPRNMIPEDVPELGIQAIARIEGGYYTEAIRCLLNLIDECHFGEKDYVEEF